MDVATFFSRLLQPPKEGGRNREEDDIRDFDAAWTSVKETLEYPNERQIIKGIKSTDVPDHLQHIVDALVYEANRTDEDTTGACLEYFFKNDLLAELERLSENDRPHGIKVEVVKLINNLVVLLSERFLVHNAVHRPLRRLLKSCIGDDSEEGNADDNARVYGAASYAMSREDSEEEDALEGDLVDLMCVLCSRMRAYPPLLLIFFHDKGWLQPHPSSGAPVLDATPPAKPNDVLSTSVRSDKATHHFEFLLFSYLLRFAHREGRVGDLARAGLLFLFDIAFLTPNEEGGENLHTHANDIRGGSDPLQDARDALAEFILDGDFADVMSAGIGAIYSLLPTKLRIPSLAAQATIEEGITASTSGGMHLGGSVTLDQHIDPNGFIDALDLPSTSDPGVRDKIDLLLKLFGFLQDIIYRCSAPVIHADAETSAVSPAHVLGAAITEATLAVIQTSFLENVLYPSILESSPNDGSSVAVMTYLDVLCSHLDDGPLLSTIVSFLMDTGDSSDPSRQVKRGTTEGNEHRTDYFADEGRFTLKDLLLDNVNSTNWTASTTALRLLQTVLGDHCRHSVKGLLSVARDSAATALTRRPIPALPPLAPVPTATSGPLLSPLQETLTLDNTFVTDDFLPAPVNSTDVHLQEVELYGSLISRIDPLQSSTELTAGYAGYLADMHNTLQADPCFVSSHVPLRFVEDDEQGEDDEKAAIKIGHFDSDQLQHRMNPGDPLILAVLNSFGDFFRQSPDQNVALTGALTTLAVCPYRSLGGWLLYDTRSFSEPDPWSRSAAQMAPLEDGDAASDVSWDDVDRTSGKRHSNDSLDTRNGIDLPAIYQTLRDLVRQVNRFRLDIDDFDRLLSERRQGLLFADHLDEAMNIMLDVEPSAFGLPSNPTTQPNLATPLPKRPKPGLIGGGGGGGGLGGALKSFLTPKRKTSPATSSPGPSGLGLGRGAAINTPSALREAAGKVNASPFKAHYEQTSLMTLEASGSSPIASGPWSPARLPKPQDEVASGSRPRSGLSQVEMASASGRSGSGSGSGEDDPTRSIRSGQQDRVEGMTVFLRDGEEKDERRGGEGGGEASAGKRVGPSKVTLSAVLDNCVILEEFLKEVVAVITARRALGIDQVGFV